LVFFNRLYRHFWITFSGFFLAVLFNTLAEGKYIDYSFILVLISSFLSATILVILQKKNTENVNVWVQPADSFRLAAPTYGLHGNSKRIASGWLRQPSQ